MTTNDATPRNSTTELPPIPQEPILADTMLSEDRLDEDGLPLFDDLQPLFDEQSRRLEAFLSSLPPLTLASLDTHTSQQRYRAAYRLLALLNIAVGAYALLTLLPAPYILVRVVGLLLVAANAVVTLHSLLALHREKTLTHTRRITAAPSLTALRQAATISATAMVVLICVSCLYVGDGQAMSQHLRADRAATILTIDKSIAQL